MPHQIIIQTGARLHFGLLANEPASGRNFGGVGMMIDSPGYRLVVQKSEFDSVECRGCDGERVEMFIQKYRENSSPEVQIPACRIEVTQQIPSHRGLGSGTQLGMAIAKASSMLSSEGEVCPDELARRVGRGVRSALGVHGFAQGGFLVDGGKSEADEIGVLQSRLEFPTEWRILLVSPTDDEGLSGTAELDAFAKLDPMPATTTERLSCIIEQNIMPAVHTESFEELSEAIFQYGRIVGEYFAPVQAGVLADARMEQLADWLRSEGVRGVGQTSWGPTLAVFCRDEVEAKSLKNRIAKEERWNDCSIQVASPLNLGAKIEVS